MSTVDIRHLHFQYQSSEGEFLIDDLSLVVSEGSFCVLLGPSGCGKTTVLNAVAGLLKPGGATSIQVAGNVLFDAKRKINVAPDKRKIGMVFQSYALWPHKTARENVSYPLRRRGTRGAALRRRVDEVLELMRCGELAERYPSELSGGQQQRVSLARALAAEPSLLLLDEPLSNLDAELRRDLRGELSLLHRRLGFTALYVTHDQVEALGLGTMVVVMRTGRIEQVGDPQEVFETPSAAYTANFFGANTWTAKVANNRAVTPLGAIKVDSRIRTPEVVVAAYPDRITLEENDEGALTVQDSMFVGQRREYLVNDRAGAQMHVHSGPLRPAVGVGARVRAQIADRDVHVFPSDQVTADPCDVGADVEASASPSASPRRATVARV